MDAKYAINRASPFTRLVRWIRRSAIEWWKDENVVSQKSSYRKMIRVLRKGKDADGNRIDIKTFDSRSARTLKNLYKEVKSLDVVLVYNPKTQRVERHAQKVTVLIKNIKLGLVWLEVERRYPNGEVREKLQEFTIRETRKRRKLPKQAVFDGLRQELEYYPNSWEVVQLEVLDRLDPHESSVYYGLQSRDTIIPFVVNSEGFWRSDGFVIKDYGDDVSEASDDWVIAIIQSFPAET